MTDTVTTEQAAPDAAQDQTPSPPQNVQPPAQASQGGTGPWAAHLQLFDESVRPQVDALLRDVVQPHVTRLEQRAAEASTAMRLMEDLRSNPGDTYMAITEELFGEEGVEKILQALGADEDDEDEATAETPEAQTTADPELEEIKRERREAKAKAEYDKELARITQAHPEVDEDLFHPFVYSADGDFDAAYQAYSVWHAKAYPAQPANEEAPTPPPTLGSQHATAPAPPVQKSYSSLNDAIDDFFTEVAQQAPPTVGAV